MPKYLHAISIHVPIEPSPHKPFLIRETPDYRKAHLKSQEYQAHLPVRHARKAKRISRRAPTRAASLSTLLHTSVLSLPCARSCLPLWIVRVCLHERKDVYISTSGCEGDAAEKDTSYNVDDNVDAQNIRLQLKIEDVDGGTWKRQELGNEKEKSTHGLQVQNGSAQRIKELGQQKRRRKSSSDEGWVMARTMSERHDMSEPRKVRFTLREVPCERWHM